MNCKALESLRALSLVPLAALCLASASSQAQTSPSMGGSASMPQGHMQQGATAPHDMKQSMMTGMERMQKLQTTGDIDKDFATMMKVHHQQALDMAETELARGKSPVMKAMARQIITAQKKEIARFDQWLAKSK